MNREKLKIILIILVIGLAGCNYQKDPRGLIALNSKGEIKRLVEETLKTNDISLINSKIEALNANNKSEFIDKIINYSSNNLQTSLENENHNEFFKWIQFLGEIGMAAENYDITVENAEKSYLVAIEYLENYIEKHSEMEKSGFLPYARLANLKIITGTYDKKVEMNLEKALYILLNGKRDHYYLNEEYIFEEYLLMGKNGATIYKNNGELEKSINVINDAINMINEKYGSENYRLIPFLYMLTELHIESNPNNPDKINNIINQLIKIALEGKRKGYFNDDDIDKWIYGSSVMSFNYNIEHGSDEDVIRITDQLLSSKIDINIKNDIINSFSTNLISKHVTSGELLKAKNTLYSLYTLTKKHLGSEDNSTLQILWEKSKLELILRNYIEAENILKKFSDDYTRSSRNFLFSYEAFNYSAISLYDNKSIDELIYRLRNDIEIVARKIGKNSLLYSNLNNKLGLYYTNNGKLSKGIGILNESLIIYKNILGNEHPLTNQTRASIALRYSNLGLHDKAENLSKEAIRISEAREGKDNDYSLILKMNLALDFMSKGDFVEALDIYKKSLKVLKSKDMTPEEIFLLQTNAALLYSLNNDNEKAESLALETYKGINELSSFDKVHQWNNLGVLSVIYSNKAEYEEAKYYSDKALKFAEDNFNKYDTAILWSKSIKTLVSLAAGDIDLAAKNSKDSLLTSFDFAWKNLPYLPISERNLAIKDTRAYEANFSHKLFGKSGKELALFARLNFHGLLAEIEKAQNKISSLNTKDAGIIIKMKELINELSSINISKDKRQLLESNKDIIEREMFNSFPELEPKIVTVNQIANILPKNSILIEFQKYRTYEKLNPASFIIKQPFSEIKYIALILKPSGSIESVDLGSADDIDKVIKEALYSSEKGLDDASFLWTKLGDLVLKPLLQDAKGFDTWFISPDAELNLVPFSAIKLTGDISYLSSTINLRLITTGRELLNLAKNNNSESNQSLVVANPNFDFATKLNNNQGEEIYSENLLRARSRDLDLFNWLPLEGTIKEGNIVSKLINSKLLMQDNATAASVQKTISPRILHIASHAYFTTNVNDTNESSFLTTFISNTQNTSIKPFHGEHALLRSGIALAGANYPNSMKDDDGYLTALEFTKLNLNGTEMVVLSACESGKGDIQSGEGVYGLKRAIAVAGARSSLLSLWKVDDYATATFMESFYKRLKAGEGRADALAATQKEFRTSPIALNRHPYVWAAFQLSGDWRPIENF